MINTIPLTAGQRVEFREPGDFFRVLAAAAALTVEFYENGREIAEAVGIGAGYAEKFERGTFDRIAITSATAQTVQFVTRLGNTVQYDSPPTGDVNVKNTAGPFFQQLVWVYIGSSSIRPANANRRYLLIVNKHPTYPIEIFVNGTSASLGPGIRLNPGDSLEFNNFVPSGAITGVSDIDNNSQVLVVEG